MKRAVSIDQPVKKAHNKSTPMKAIIENKRFWPRLLKISLRISRLDSKSVLLSLCVSWSW
jgi:hypothetical protein